MNNRFLRVYSEVPPDFQAYFEKVVDGLNEVFDIYRNLESLEGLDLEYDIEPHYEKEIAPIFVIQEFLDKNFIPKIDITKKIFLEEEFDSQVASERR